MAERRERDRGEGADDPSLAEELREVFQRRVDGLERDGAAGLEDLVARVGGRSRPTDRVRHLERKLDKAARRALGRQGGRRRRRARDEDPERVEQRRRLRAARRRANRRIGFVTHFGSYLATLALLLVTTRSLRIAIIVALGWGIGVFCHYLWAIAAPRLRDRWLEDEVGVRSERDVRSERRAVETRSRRSLEDLSASIAHEIRNPITAAKSLVQQMGEDPASDENLEYAGLALSELDRVERSISHLLRYARDEEPRLEPIELRALARAAVDGLRERARERGVRLSLEFETPGLLRGDPEKLRRVIENLIANAIDAVAEAGREDGRIDVLGGESLAGSEVWLRVIDDGPGIPEAERERIWSPFYTTKESGTGLGLALSRKTVEAHGGRIELLSDPRQGSEFVLTFPAESAAGDEGARTQEGVDHGDG